MTIELNASANSVSSLQSALDAIIFSANANDLCRTIVHGDFTGVETHGAHIFVLDHNSNLKQVASYGMAHEAIVDEISVWDNNPIAKCIQSKDLYFEKARAGSGSRALVCLPFMKDTTPVGCLVLTVAGDVTEIPNVPGLVPVVAKLGAFYLEHSGVAGSSRKEASSNSNGNGDDLTKRQIRILEMMAEGMSNVEIAREMLLSESSIRQETVRIYRSLSVGGRAEASKKAKSLGIISGRSSNSAPPPAILTKAA